MGLREIAEADLAFILEDGRYGFGFSITLTDPDGLTKPFTGFSNDIAQAIDPETGELVTGRAASAVIRLASIYAAGMKIPQGIAANTSKPWVVKFNDINGKSYTFKVSKSNPDRAIGIVSLLLESYEE